MMHIKKNKKKYTRKMISYEVIEKVTNGDIDAICEVLKYYEQYTNKLSLREYYDSYGKAVIVLDEDIKQVLQIKLITKIVEFKLDKLS